MARLLDQYKSPANQRSIDRNLLIVENDKSLLIPQACSSPISSSSIFHTSRAASMDTPSPRHESSSTAKPSSHVPSWQKHSMRPMPSPHARNISGSTKKGEDFNEHNNEHGLEHAKNSPQTTTNRPRFHQVQITPVEDSYWSISKNQAFQQNESTPSPVKSQNFYTAKQSQRSIDESLIVESLRIPSMAYQQSPSMRRPASVASLHIEPMETNEDEASDKSVILSTSGRGELEREADDRTNRATQGDITRRSTSIGSELSRVNSQATSLQQAISIALNDGKTKDASAIHDEFGNLPTEDAIIARYRQSRSDRSHATIAHQTSAQDTRFPSSPGTLHFQPRMHVEQIAEPLKHASPLIGSHSQQDSDVERDNLVGRSFATPFVSDTLERNANQSNTADLLNKLSEITAECIRRGDIINDRLGAAPPVEDTDTNTRAALEVAESRAALFEQQLAAHQIQMQQMKDALYDLQTQHRASLEVQASKPEKASLAAGPSADPLKQSLPNDLKARIDAHQRDKIARDSDIHSQSISSHPAESFVDKIQRWEQSFIEPEPIDTRKDSFVYMREMPVQYDHHSLSPNDSRSNAYNITPRVTQVNDFSLASSGKLPRPSMTDTEGEIPRASLEAALRSAEAELQALKLAGHQQQTKTSGVQRTKPLTANMMPDAGDEYICPEEKLYTRLQLNRIDTLEHNELGNLVKNILIQLDVPYDKLAETITEFGSHLSNGEDEVHANLIQESIKLRQFAEDVHATLYSGTHIEGTITSRKCLTDMAGRVCKMQRAIERRRSGKVSFREEKA